MTAYLNRTNWLLHCPVPCTKTVYEAKHVLYHRNNGAGTEDQDSCLTFLLRHETLTTEEHVETLMYDTGNFLVQVGGNLGLFLGFSCYSLLLDMTRIWKC